MKVNDYNLNGELEQISTKLVPCYGGQKILVNCVLTTTTDNFIHNSYIVDLELRQFDFSPSYSVYSVTLPIEEETNSETLTEEGVINLLNGVLN